MKKLVAAAAIGAAITLAPVAHADTTQYLNYLHGEGFSSGKGDQGLINIGNASCSDKARGVSKAAVAAKILASNPKLDSQGASEIADAAWLYLCP